MARYRSEGPIDFDDIQEFFGETRGSAWNLDDYYRGGGIVPATGPNNSQSAIHQIAIDPTANSVEHTDTFEEFDIYLTGRAGLGVSFPTSFSTGQRTLSGAELSVDDVTFNNEPTVITLDSVSLNASSFPSAWVQPIEFTRTYIEDPDMNPLGVDDFTTIGTPNWFNGTFQLEVYFSSTDRSTLATYLGLSEITESSQTISFNSSRYMTLSYGNGNRSTGRISRISRTGDIVSISAVRNNDAINPGTVFDTNGESVTITFDDNSAERAIRLELSRNSVTYGGVINLIILRQNVSIAYNFIVDTFPQPAVFDGSPASVSIQLLEDEMPSTETINISNLVAGYNLSWGLSSIVFSRTGTARTIRNTWVLQADPRVDRITSSTDEELRDNLIARYNEDPGPYTVTAITRSIDSDVYEDTSLALGRSGISTSSGGMLITVDTTEDLSQDTRFNTAGNMLLIPDGTRGTYIAETTGEVFRFFITTEPNRWSIFIDNIRTIPSQAVVDQNIHIRTGTEPTEVPVARFRVDSQNRPTTVVQINNSSVQLEGYLTVYPRVRPEGGFHVRESQAILVTESVMGDITSEIQINLGDGIFPQTEDIILGEQDSQGIADVITQSLDGHGQVFATALTNAVRIEYLVQQDSPLPVITVPVSGTANLQASDFTSTEIRAGEPTSRTTDYPNIEYSTDDVSSTGTGWNFHQSVTGDRVNLTTWPNTGSIFLHIGINDVVFDDIETTLGITEITQTMQAVTFTTLTFSYLFLGLTPVATSYSVTGIRLLGTSAGNALVLVLDATTEVQSHENTDPLFTDEQVVGLTFFRRPEGPINEGIPPMAAVTNLNVTAEYSTNSFSDSGGVTFQNAAGQAITLSSWPTSGNFLVRFSSDVFDIGNLRLLLRLNRLPDTTPQDVSDVTIRMGITTSFGNNIATYNISSVRTVSNTNPSIILTLDGSTVADQEGTGGFGNGLSLPVNLNSPITRINSLSISDFYNANNGNDV